MLGMEAYVDEILVKSVKRDWQIDDLQQAFECMSLRDVRLNPLKCVFELRSGKFLDL